MPRAGFSQLDIVGSGRAYVKCSIDLISEEGKFLLQLFSSGPRLGHHLKSNKPFPSSLELFSGSFYSN